MTAVSTQAQPAQAELTGICAGCGAPGTRKDPLELDDARPYSDTPVKVHRSHFSDPNSGFYDPARVEEEGWQWYLQGKPVPPPARPATRTRQRKGRP
jgi:hypothetical protein